MRLICADAFKTQVASMVIVHNYPVTKGNAFCKLIDKQKTAYDLDKVVEQLDEKVQLAYRRYMNCPSNSPCFERYRTQYQERKLCLDIVKCGFVSDQSECSDCK